MISFLVLPFLFLITGIISSPLPTFALPPLSSALHHRSFTRRSHIASFLWAHNQVRLQHNAPPLRWSSSLAEKAEQWANACNFRHTNGVLSDTPYGENVVAATGDFPISDAVATFTRDGASYDPVNPVYNHFTQVVWESTTELGCASATCSNIFPDRAPATLYVCLYDPPGNVVGHILENVHM